MTEELLEPRDVVALTGLSIETLRYYEREGIIGPVARRAGHRRYSGNDVAWIGLVTCLRNAGLGIADLRRFTTLLSEPTEPQDRVTFLRERRKELLQRLTETQAAIDVLDGKIAHYTAEI